MGKAYYCCRTVVWLDDIMILIPHNFHDQETGSVFQVGLLLAKINTV